VQVVVLAACEPRGHRFERWPLHIARCVGKTPPLITSPRPHTVREPTTLGTSFFFLVIAVEANHFCFLIFLKQVAPCHFQGGCFIPEAVRCWYFGTELW
jgi:hypothetical protein